MTGRDKALLLLRISKTAWRQRSVMSGVIQDFWGRKRIEEIIKDEDSSIDWSRNNARVLSQTVRWLRAYAETLKGVYRALSSMRKCSRRRRE